MKLPSGHPILNLQNQVGSFSHLLPRELIADRSYWISVEKLVRGREVKGTSGRQHIPLLMLPIFRRMIEAPFDLLVSIPRAGDPLAYALYRMAECLGRIGIPLAKIPRHESFGGNDSSVPMVNFLFLQDAECEGKVAPETKARVLKMVEALSSDMKGVLFRKNSFETFKAALDEDLGSLVRWFINSGTGTHFAKVAIPLLSDLMQETAVALDLKGVERILLIDDCTNDLLAYDSVHYPLSVFAPQAQFEVGLLAGNEHDVKDLNAVCGCFHGAWIMMKRDEWTGEKAGVYSGQLGNETMALLWPSMKSEMSIEDEHDRKGIFSLLIYEILYQKGLVFSQGASWGRKKIRQRFEKRYGEENLLAWQALLQRKVTPQFIEALNGSSALFARMTQGRLEIDRATERLFGNDLSRRLLEPYLRSGHGYEEMRPLSDLLILINV